MTNASLSLDHLLPLGALTSVIPLLIAREAYNMLLALLCVGDDLLGLRLALLCHLALLLGQFRALALVVPMFPSLKAYNMIFIIN